MTTVLTRRPLFEGAEWNFELLKKSYDAIEEIGVGEMGLDIYTNQIEVITAEQMLDAYASIGMPNMYRHWSFGKHFAREEALYRKGARALAYEPVKERTYFSTLGAEIIRSYAGRPDRLKELDVMAYEEYTGPHGFAYREVDGA